MGGVEVCEPVEGARSVIRVEADRKRHDEENADSEESECRRLLLREFRYTRREPSCDHNKRSRGEHDPRREIGLEDSIHPEISIAHIVFQVDEFAGDEDREAEECEQVCKVCLFLCERS